MFAPRPASDVSRPDDGLSILTSVGDGHKRSRREGVQPPLLPGLPPATWPHERIGPATLATWGGVAYARSR